MVQITLTPTLSTPIALGAYLGVVNTLPIIRWIKIFQVRVIDVEMQELYSRLHQFIHEWYLGEKF